MQGRHTRYQVDLGRHRGHTVDVALEIAGAGELGDAITVKMAAWCPGSYLVRDYARFIRSLAAEDQNGRPLAVTKTSKHSWSIEAAGAAAVTVRYAVYGYDLSVRTNHIDDSHAFLHGPATFLYVDGQAGAPAEVELTGVPDAWSIHAGLEPTGDPKRWRAADLDSLLDGPIHAGPVESRSFEVAGVPFEIAAWGAREPGVHDLDQLADDVAAIVETHAARLGGLPLDRYTFLLMLAPRAYGGLEHKHCSANLASSHVFTHDKPYQDLLELLSHEFFHIWNGKRVFPAALSRFDYERENYTRCLWVIEGLTSFFDRYTVLRAGRMDPARYLEKLADEWARLLATPGRDVHDLEEASFDAWVKLYKPDPFNLNSTVSYYLKGGLVATCLDLTIRRLSLGQRSLADVLELLWTRFGAEGRGYPEDVQAIFEEATGLDLSEPFERWVRGTEDPDLRGELAHLGLGLAPVDNGDEPRSYLGVKMADHPLRIRGVLDGSPAAEAGLAPGDHLIAVDGLEVTSDAELKRRVGRRDPGSAVELALFRRRQLQMRQATLAESPPPRWQIAASSHPTDEEKQRFSDWLGAPWPDQPLAVTGGGKGWT